MERTLATLCELVHGELIGNGDSLIRGLNTVEAAGDGDLTFAEDATRLSQAIEGHAAAILVSKDVRTLRGHSGIRVEHPKLAFLVLLELYHPEGVIEPGVHASAILAKGVRLSQGVAIGAHAVLAEGVEIGADTAIGEGVSIAEGVIIGKGCRIHPNVVIYRRTQIGDHVQIHGGSVIGGDGFGYVFHQGRYVKVPQVGNVVIEDDVEIGCNVCVDRATMGSTMIRQGTKIDNLVQVAHNNRIGKHVALAGQVGLAGSVHIGDYAMLGGQVGVIDHLRIGQGVKVGAGSIVTKSVADGGHVWGFAARPVRQVTRQMAEVSRLSVLAKTVRDLVKRLRQSEARVARLEERLP